jgi:hypothetical protein
MNEKRDEALLIVRPDLRFKSAGEVLISAEKPSRWTRVRYPGTHLNVSLG